MATVPPPPPPPPPSPPPVDPLDAGEPSNRWPWVALGLGVLLLVVAAGFYFLSRPRSVDLVVEGTPTVNPVARGTSSPGPPATLVPPTLLPSATLAPTPTPVTPPTPTAAPPTPAPPPAAAPPQTPVAGGPKPEAPTQAPPAATMAPTPPPPPAAATAPPASPTPFAGQAANTGGVGNTRADLDAAYGASTGETPERLTVYRKNNFEYHVRFAPDPRGRAALIVLAPQPNSPPLTLELAMAEARKLLPKDAQPPTPQPEANERFVVERFTSQSLAQALAADVFTSNKGQPGQFLVVYVRESQQQNRISRVIIGPGNDPQALIDQGR